MSLVHKFAEEGRLVVFAGAGVSMSAPTSLPSWWDIHKAVAEALAKRVAELIGAERSHSLAANIVGRQRAEKFPPEYQAELVADRMDKSYFEVLQCLDSNTPNMTHLGLAALARSGKLRTILTTNFDRAIEAAFRQLCVPLEVHSHHQHFTSLASDLARFGRADVPCQLLKIHGSADDPETLVDTLAQRKRGFSASLHACIRYLLRFGHWLFLGYSGDDLAAEPNYLHLRGDVTEARGFTWLVRPKTEPRLPVQRLKQVYMERAEIIFGELPGWMTGIVQAVCPAELLASNYGATSAELPGRIEMHVSQWAGRQRLDHCVLVMAELLKATNQPEEAFDLVQRLHDRTPETERASKHFGTVLSSLAIMHEERGNYDQALTFFNRTLALFEPGEWTEQQAGTFTNMALVFERQGQTDQSVDLLTKALRLFDQVQHSEGRAVALHNLALAESNLGHYEEAVSYLHKELELLRVLGNESGRGQALNDLGMVLRNIGKFDQAIVHLEEARDIHARLGDEHGFARALGNLANIYFDRRDFSKARQAYEKIRLTFTHFDDKLAMATTLGNLACVALEEKLFTEAGELVVQALELAEPAGKQTGNLAERARLHEKLGAIRSRQGQTLEAIRSLERARTLYKQLKMPVLYCDCLIELGIAYRADRRLAEAESCFRETLDLFQNMPRDHHYDMAMDYLANILSKRGLEAQERHQLQQALAFFEESAIIWEKGSSLYNLSGAYQNIGNTHIIAGDLNRSLSAYAKALTYRDQSSALAEGIPLLCTMAETEAAQGHLEEALQKYEQAWMRAEEVKTREMVRDRIDDSAAQFSRQSLALPALQLYRACLRFNEQLGYAPAIAAAKFNIGALLFQQLGRKAEALPLLRQAVEIFAEHHHPFAENARQLLARCETDAR